MVFHIKMQSLYKSEVWMVPLSADDKYSSINT